MREAAVYASIRRYEGNDRLADAVASHAEEVERILREIAGFRAYYMARTAEGAVSVTVCDDEAAAQESNRVAAEWVRSAIPDAASTPTVGGGEVVLSF
jgi:4-diphosphocytidyl-2C-methyl-D-erythritol kinase